MGSYTGLGGIPSLNHWRLSKKRVTNSGGHQAMKNRIAPVRMERATPRSTRNVPTGNGVEKLPPPIFPSLRLEA